MKEVFVSVLERCFLNCYYMAPQVIINKLMEITSNKYETFELERKPDRAVIVIGENTQIWFYLSPSKVIRSIEVY